MVGHLLQRIFLHLLMRFNGIYKCKLDNNGRVKLPPKVLADFSEGLSSTPELVLFCLPEGAIALFQPQTWELLRSNIVQQTPDLLDDLALRRKARRIAAFTDSQEVSPQGRITLPALFREKLDFRDGEELVITGNERGYELWTARQWSQETLLLDET